MAYLPDHLYWMVLWITNRHNARKRFPNPVKFIRYRRALRRALWS